MSTAKSVNVDVDQFHKVTLRAGNGAVLFPPREFPDQTRARAFGRRVAIMLAVDRPVELTYLDRTRPSVPKLVRVKFPA